MSSTHTPPQSKRQLLFISRRNRELEQEAERARKLSFIEVDSKLVNEIQRLLEIEKKVATRMLKEANGSAEKCLKTFLDEEKWRYNNKEYWDAEKYLESFALPRKVW